MSATLSPSFRCPDCGYTAWFIDPATLRPCAGTSAPHTAPIISRPSPADIDLKQRRRELRNRLSVVNQWLGHSLDELCREGCTDPLYIVGLVQKWHRQARELRGQLDACGDAILAEDEL